MPLARIEVRKTWPAEKVQAIIEAVYQAQREALKVPERDRTIRYIEHRPEHFHAPPDKAKTTPWWKSPCLPVARSMPNAPSSKASSSASRLSAFPPPTFSLYLVDPEKLDFRCRRPSLLFFETIAASRKFGANKLRPTAAACGSSSQRRSEWH
jgi:hypothetical protein